MIKNYELVKEEQIKELNGTGYVYRHKKTGARVVVISNEDDNKVFQIGFKTPPKDDTGVPHIMEHSVLCGSREFPLKDPFVELVKGSLNTFLNAMTYPDKTVYPVASCNDKDFFNLMHVYLDAVFYPNIYTKPEILKQEGWHYSLESEDAPVTYNGVVYNEMKGVFSSPDQQLARLIQKSLLSDTPYGFESGGDPEAIPELSYEQFLDFHRTYYHPSNSYIYLYGDMDPEEYLEFIDEHYLSDFDKKQVDTSWEPQKAFSEVKRVEEVYPVSEQDGTENKTFLSYNAVIGTSLDKELYIAFQILDRALFSMQGAPVKKALMEAGIAKDISSSYDNGIEQPVFSVVAQEADEKKEEEFVRIIEEMLQKISEEGIQRRSLEAALNYYEFQYKEANFGRFPKGLMYGLQMYDSWLYDDDEPFMHVKTNEVFAFLREQLDGSYFTDLIKTYLLSNTHKSIVVLKPEKGLQTRKDQKTAEQLREFKESLLEEELRQLVKSTKELKEYQEAATPKEDLEKIPLLDIKDIKKEIRPLCNEEVLVDGVKIIWHPYFTNQICYLKMVFDMSRVPARLVPYVSLMSEVFRSVDTKKHSYFELGNEIGIETGGMVTTMDVLPDGTDGVKSYFIIRTKCFYENADKAFELMEEILFDSKLDDKKRLKEIIGQIYTNMKTDLAQAGHKTASNRAMSYFSPYARYKEQIQGVSMFEFVKDWYESFEQESDKIADNMKEACRYIFRKENLMVSYTGKEKKPSFMEDAMHQFTGRMFTEDLPEEETKILPENMEEGFATAGGVQYVACAGNFATKGYEYTGALNVLQVIFSYEYLWLNIRVKGGAYGCMCSFMPQGDSMFVSYRDPNLLETYQVFENAADFVEHFDIDDRDMVKYIIGTISNMDTPLEPDDLGERSFQAYLLGRTEAELQKYRDQVLSCDQETIRSLAPYVRCVVDAGNNCTIGNEDKLEEAKDKFKEIRHVF